jgi:hypothetical protein
MQPHTGVKRHRHNPVDFAEADAAPSSELAEERPSKCTKLGDTTDPCAICLAESIEYSATLDCCIHTFCFGCIHQWTTDISSTCPLCKREVHSIASQSSKQQVMVQQKQQRPVVYQEDLQQQFNDSDEEEGYESDEFDARSDASDWCFNCEENIGDLNEFVRCRGPCGDEFHEVCFFGESKKVGGIPGVCDECQEPERRLRGALCAECQGLFQRGTGLNSKLFAVPCSDYCGRYFHLKCVTKFTFDASADADNSKAMEILPCMPCLRAASEQLDDNDFDFAEQDGMDEDGDLLDNPYAFSRHIILFERDQGDQDEADQEEKRKDRIDLIRNNLLDKTEMLQDEIDQDFDAENEPTVHDAAYLMDDKDIDDDVLSDEESDEETPPPNSDNSEAPAWQTDPNEKYDARLMKQLRLGSIRTVKVDVDDYPDSDESDQEDEEVCEDVRLACDYADCI